MIKRKRNRVMALGGILAVAGCSGGGSSAPAPVTKPAQTANHPLSTAKLTLNPTLLRHASTSRRRPAFIDPGNGQAFSGGSLSLRVTSMTNDGSNLAPPPTTQVITLGSTAPIQLAVPLYGPTGFIRIQEIYQSPLVTVAPQLIADTESGGLASTSVSAVTYSFNPGAASENVTITQNNTFFNGPITLTAVIGGVVIADTPDGSGANTHFVPVGNPNGIQFAVTSGEFVFVFPADATGGFTPSTVPGGFPSPVNVTLDPLSITGGFSLTPTITTGAFVVNTSGTSCGLFSADAVFDVVDGLNNHGSTAGTGYLNMIHFDNC